MAVVMQPQRVSPGVYRGANGALTQPNKGILKIPKAVKPAPVVPGAPPANVPTTGGPLLLNQPNPNTPAVPPTTKTLAQLNAERAQTINEIHRRGGLSKATGFSNQLNNINGQIRSLRVPKATTPVDATTQPIADNIANATPPADTAGQDNANTLFPNERMFEPSNYEGSPLYQFQLQEGNKQVARSLAKRGLTGSGAGIQEELNVPLRAAAQDTDRMTRVAEGNAERLYNMQNNEANRLQRQGENQWGRIYDTASLMAQQNPFAQAFSGLNSSADATNKAGQSEANFLRDYYQKIMAGGGGGGSGGGSTAQPIPIPGQPNYSNITPSQISGNYGSNTGWLNLLTKGIGSFLQ